MFSSRMLVAGGFSKTKSCFYRFNVGQYDKLKVVDVNMMRGAICEIPVLLTALLVAYNPLCCILGTQLPRVT